MYNKFLKLSPSLAIYSIVVICGLSFLANYLETNKIINRETISLSSFKMWIIIFLVHGWIFGASILTWFLNSFI
jgi:hypothetical protein